LLAKVLVRARVDSARPAGTSRSIMVGRGLYAACTPTSGNGA
jgi:hypothetical protein